MKITFLGTGTSQGVPVIACQCNTCKSMAGEDKRLRTSVLIEHDNTTLVIDSGPDFRQQLLRKQVLTLDAILFTHEHKDHIAGLDDVRSFNYLLKKPMEVYCTERVSHAVKREFAYAFEEVKYPGVPEININIIENKKFSINQLEIIPIEGLHHKLTVFGYRIGNFAYLTDINFIPDEEKHKLQNLDVLVLGAVRKKAHLSHYNLSQAIDVIHELKAKTGYITHISHMMGLHSEVSAELPTNIHLAFDGLELNL